MAEVITDQDTIVRWLVEHVGAELKVDPESLPHDRAFFELGLNSLNTLVISGELAEFLGGDDLSPSLFWDYPTIEKLANHLSHASAGRAG